MSISEYCKRRPDVTNYYFSDSACGVTPEGTRVDFPPPTTSDQEKSVESSAPDVPITTAPEHLTEDPEKTQVDVSSMSVEADESNQGRQIVS